MSEANKIWNHSFNHTTQKYFTIVTFKWLFNDKPKHNRIKYLWIHAVSQNNGESLQLAFKRHYKDHDTTFHQYYLAKLLNDAKYFNHCGLRLIQNK